MLEQREKGQGAHGKKHSDEKKYACQECGKLFKGSRGLKYHIKIHQGLFNFPCIECNKKFVRSTSLKTHIRVCHQNQNVNLQQWKSISSCLFMCRIKNCFQKKKKSFMGS